MFNPFAARLFANGIEITELYGHVIGVVKRLNRNLLESREDCVNLCYIARNALHFGEDLLEITRIVSSFEWRFDDNTRWTDSQGFYHRIEGPAIIYPDKNYWWVGGIEQTSLVQFCLVKAGFKPDTHLGILADKMAEIGDLRLQKIISPYQGNS